MSEEEKMEQMLAEAIQTKRPVLVNPTDDEIRRAAEGLRQEGRLICTACRKPIREENFRTQRISFSPRLQAVAHLHTDCEKEFSAAMDERAERNA